MTQKDAYLYWFASARDTAQAASDNFDMKHYDWSLFLWHLVIEKTLKGMIVKHGQVPPPVHDLEKLIYLAKVMHAQSYISDLKEISTYNIEARYDDYKRSFYKKSTKEYAAKWAKKCEEIYLWLSKQI